MSRIGTASRNAGVDGIVDQIETGAGTAQLQIYTGTGPATFGDAAAGDLLVAFDLGDPAFGSGGASNPGEAILAGTPISATGVGDGTAGYAVIVDQNGDEVWDTEDVGTSGNEVTLSTTTISTGLDVDLTAGTITVPEGSL